MARRPGAGGRWRLWAFGLDDLAAMLGAHRDTVREWLRLGAFDPVDMRSVVAFMERRWERDREPAAEPDHLARVALTSTVYVAAAPDLVAAASRWVLESLPGCAPVAPPLAVECDLTARAARALARGCDRVVVWDDPKLAARDDVTGRVVVLVDAAMREAVADGASPWETRWRLASSLRAFAYEDRDRAGR